MTTTDTIRKRIKTELDAAGRASMMAVQRHDHREFDLQSKRIRKLLRRLSKLRADE
jgi:hypothetical protein